MCCLRKFTPASNREKEFCSSAAKTSDVHLLASHALSCDRYRRVDVGDVDGLVDALHAMERAVTTERRLGGAGTDPFGPIEVNAHGLKPGPNRTGLSSGKEATACWLEGTHGC